MESTIFGYFETQAQAEEAASMVRERFPEQNFAITVRQVETKAQPPESMPKDPTMSEITSKAMELGATMGTVAGQMVGLTMGSMLNGPMMMMNMMMSPMANSAMAPTGSRMEQPDSHSQKFTVSLQGEGGMEELTDILKSHGAEQVKIYRENT